MFSYCAPLDLANPGVEVVDIDTPTHKVVSSTCYDPATQIGLAPHVSIIPGAGSVSANATPSPFTCNSFAEEDSQNYFSKHKYGLKFNPAAIASSGDATKTLSLPSTWTGNTFPFTTAGFEIMAVGTQNSVTGYFDWVSKPYAGFEHDLPAISPAAEVDCDPAATISRTGCRIFSDGSPFLIVTTQPVADATGVTLTRSGGASAPADYTVDTSFDAALADPNTGFLGRIITITPAVTFEPGQTYTVTVDPTMVTAAPANGETNVTTLEKPTGTTQYSFTAGPGPLGPAAGSNVIFSSTPASGAVKVAHTLSRIRFLFQLPVEPASVSTATFSVTRSDGKTIAGTAAVDTAHNNQRVTWTPTTTPTLFGAVYTVNVSGVKVGPNVPGAGLTFSPFSMTFTTQQFTTNGIFSGTTKVDGKRNMPLESLLNGDWNIQFLDKADPTTVSTSTVQLASAGAAPAFTITDSGDHQKYNLKLTDATTPIKFGTQYLVTSTTGIKEATAANGGASESTGQALHAEGCSAADCPDPRGFFTKAFSASLSAPATTPPTAGNVTITFNYPIDPTTFTGNSANKLALVPGTFDITLGFQPTGSGTIAMNCALQAGNTTVKCTPATAPAANTYYRAVLTLSGVKVATPFSSKGVSVPLDQTTGTFNGTLTQTYITDCP